MRRSHNRHPDFNLQQDLEDRSVADHMDSILSYHTPQGREGNLQLCQNYRTICLSSHPSKVMLKILINRLQPLAEEIIAEEQAGFRARKSTTKQIFNLRILCEKYLKHQQNLYHVFMYSRKAFDRVIRYGEKPYGQL